MTTQTSSKNGLSAVVSQLPVDRLKQEARDFGEALTQRGIAKASDRVESLTGRLTDIGEGNVAPKMAKNIAEGDSPVKAGVKATATKAKDAVKDKLGLGGGKGQKLKVTNIVETVDVPVPREVAYQQWTQFEDFPTFMKKVENVKQEEDEKLTWKAQILWSHRSWQATIVDQVPNEHIVWKSEGEKGHVDGAVTFHELAPNLTRVVLTLEYHPKGFFEHTGNLWRAQGRRVRLELKHFRRHVATQTLLHQDELDGWEGEIHDEEVKQSAGSGEGRRGGGNRQGGRRGRTAKKTAAKKSSGARQGTSKRAPAKKTAAAKSTPAKTTGRKRTAKKTAAKKSSGTARKTAAKRAPAKTAAASGGGARRTTARKSTAKKASTSASKRSGR